MQTGDVAITDEFGNEPEAWRAEPAPEAASEPSDAVTGGNLTRRSSPPATGNVDARTRYADNGATNGGDDDDANRDGAETGTSSPSSGNSVIQ